MNTTLLKTFGQKARTLLIDGVTRKLHYWGFNKDGAVTERPESIPGGYLFREGVFDDTTVPRLWQSLEEAVNKDGLHEVAERSAYIWFNRLMALQILGKNNYEQPLLAQVSVEEQTPLLVKKARSGQYNFLNNSEQERLKKILTDYERETQVFAILLIGFCHSHSLLNRVFGTIDDYTELLLPDDILNSGGFLDLLNNGGYITDDDYKKVELIGWLYQFYISEKKDQVFKNFKDGKKAEPKDIPAATQIFTPNWIVKYMVENTVGKIWLEKHPQSPVKESLKYLVEAADNETSEPIIDEVKDLKLLDPASGSGHILVEGFELLYKMYLEEYYPADEAVESILQNNLYGLDIDLRAAQLAQFALLMKAAQYHPDILKKDIIPHIHAMPAPVNFTKEDVQSFLGIEGAAYVKPLQDVLHLMLQAQNLGSIMQFDIKEEAWNYILSQLRQWQERKDLDLLHQELLTKLKPYLHVLEVLTQQYEAIAANPPYMSSKNSNPSLKSYVDRNYAESRFDLFAVFMEVCYKHLTGNGYYGMINQHSWMFLSSFEGLREDILKHQSIVNMLHLGPRTFDEMSGEVVQSTAFVIKKEYPNNRYQGIYYRLIEERNSIAKEEVFLEKEKKCFSIDQTTFLKLPGNPIAYWASQNVVSIFEKNKTINDVALARKGNTTTNNDRYVKFWFEVSIENVAIEYESISKANNDGKYWLPYNKGGGFRRWYGYNETVCYWKNNGEEIKSLPKSVVANEKLYMLEGSTWGHINSYKFSCRYFPKGFIFDNAGNCLFSDKKDMLYLNGFLNSIVFQKLSEYTNPTLGFSSGEVAKIPIITNETNQSEISLITQENINISKSDWDSRETSWDFQTNRLISFAQKNLEECYNKWFREISDEFFKMHSNEEYLNKLFIEIFGIEEVSPIVPVTDITLLQEEIDFNKLDESQLHPENPLVLPIKKNVIIQQLVSYIIGCSMGRYRLDKPGLQIAYLNPIKEESEAYTYTSPVTGESHQIEIDEDGIIPLMGVKGNFADDAYNRLRQFLVAVWGEGALTQNINYMQDCLNQDLEDYLVKKFWAYHVRTYSKKPVYWLFSSKKGAFQALVYMHRMNRFTAEKLRDKYLLKHIQFLEQEIARMDGNTTGLAKSEQKRLDQLHKDLQECNDYDLLLKDIATKQIEFDLDEGVTRNYELFKGVVAPIK